jgi:xylulokinase
MSLLAIDIGSSQSKAVLFTAAGEVLAQSVCRYTPDFPEPTFAEMNPEKFWDAVCKTSREVGRNQEQDRVQAICLSSHGETLIPTDAHGGLVGPAILNIDSRAAKKAEWCEKRLGARWIFETTGLVAHPMYPVPKILWLREHRPEIYSTSLRFLSVTDFIHIKLGLPPYIGYSLASRFLAFDLTKGSWSAEILEAVGLRKDQLPIPVPAGSIAGKVLPEAASALGIPSGIPVIVGGHDQACGALGVGVIKPGRVADSMGTYECVVAASDAPNLGDASFCVKLNTYSHVVPGQFLTLAYFPSGIMVQWFRDLISSGSTEPTKPTGPAREEQGRDSYQQLEAACTGLPTGLCITPHLIGTCNPDFDPRARGMIFGLASDTNRSQIYQGILEGIACELAEMIGMLAAAHGESKDVYVSGGGARSALGLRLRAAFSGCRLHVMQTDEAVCQGAAILAGVAAGVYTSIADGVKRVVREKEIVEPDEALAAAYTRQRRQYSNLCATLKQFRNAESGS